MPHHACRHLAWLENRAAEQTLGESGTEALAADAGRSFALPGDVARWSRPRPFVLEHLKADLTIEVETRSIRGEATLRLRRVDPTATYVRLDAVELEIASVTSAGVPVAHRHDGAVLTVEVGIDAGRESPIEVAIRYRATPRRGLYFVTARAPMTALEPTAAPTEVWSQGQDEDNRHWLPLVDHPAERLTTDLTFRVPSDWFALSNGKLLERGVIEGRARFRWLQAEPHPPYLITLAAGRFDEAHDRHGELPVDYYVPAGRAADIARSFGKTPAMIALFEKRLGTPFPWAKYAQVVVHDFIFGGMENTSATTLYERALLDERAALDVDGDALVAHELAHQWFGDLVTCREWSHAWLNEGFATFCEHLWREHESGPDAYLYGLEHDLDAYLDEERDRYRRPIVTNVWAKPIDVFDRHLYQKGALVLHALRKHLGDELFFRGIARYLATMRGRSAETRDLLRAFEEATGRALEAFFDQWTARAGHPALEVSTEHEDGVLKVTVVQTQSQRGEASSTFAFELPVVVVSDEGESRVALDVTRPRETFAIRCTQPPRMVLIDPEMHVPGTLELRLSTALLIEQLTAAPTAQPRWRAARALAKRNEPRAVRALADVLARRDVFYGVRAEAAAALGEQRTREALEALLSASARGPDGAVVEPEPRVRRAIVAALGRFEGHAQAADRLVRWLAEGDRSYLVEAEVRRSLGRVRDSRALELLTRAFRQDGPSWGDVVKQGAVDGLGQLRELRALDVLEEATDPRQSAYVRRSAVAGLGRARTITADEARLVRVRETIVATLDAFDPGVRIAAARALAALGDPAGASALQRLVERDLDGRVRRAAREALRQLRDRTARGRETSVLRDEVEKLQKELRELRERIAALEAKK